MKTKKHTLTIKIEVLSPEVFPSLLGEFNESFSGGNTEGRLIKDDGDDIEWSISTEDVEV